MGEVDTAPPPETAEHQHHTHEAVSAGCGTCGAECAGHHTEATESADNLFSDLEIGNLSKLTTEAKLSPAGAPEKIGEHSHDGCPVGCACHSSEATMFSNESIGTLNNNESVTTTIAAETHDHNHAHSHGEAAPGHNHDHAHDLRAESHHEHDQNAKASNNQESAPQVNETTMGVGTGESAATNQPENMEPTAAAATFTTAGEARLGSDATATEQNMSSADAGAESSAAPSVTAEASSNEPTSTQAESAPASAADSSVESSVSGGPDVDTQAEQSAGSQNEARPDASLKAAEQAPRESTTNAAEERPSQAATEINSNQDTSSRSETAAPSTSESDLPDSAHAENHRPEAITSTPTETSDPDRSTEVTDMHDGVEPTQVELDSQTTSTTEAKTPANEIVPEDASTTTESFDLPAEEQIDHTEAAIIDPEELIAEEDLVASESFNVPLSPIDTEAQPSGLAAETNPHQEDSGETTPDILAADVSPDEDAVQVSPELPTALDHAEQDMVETTPEAAIDDAINPDAAEDSISTSDELAADNRTDSQEFDIDSLLEEIQSLHDEAEASSIDMTEQSPKTNHAEAVEPIAEVEPIDDEVTATPEFAAQNTEQANEEVSFDAVLASLDAPQPIQEADQNMPEQIEKQQKHIDLLAESITATLRESYEKHQHLSPGLFDKLLQKHNLALNEQEHKGLLQLLSQASWIDIHHYIVGLARLRSVSGEFNQEFAASSASTLWQQANQKLARVLTALRRFLPRTIFMSE